MSVETVKEHLARFGLEDQIITLTESSATVELAARALHTEPDQIAKSLAFEDGDGCIMVVMSGESRMHNGKFKRTFGRRCHMCSPEKTLEYTSHEPGGVSPFGCTGKTKIYLDESLKNHSTIFPAAGAGNNAIEITPEKLFEISGAVGWVNVHKDVSA